MNTRKYNTNPEVLLEQGKAIMSSTDEARFHFKVFAVNMILAGCPVSQISTMAGVSKVIGKGNNTYQKRKIIFSVFDRYIEEQMWYIKYTG